MHGKNFVYASRIFDIFRFPLIIFLSSFILNNVYAVDPLPFIQDSGTQNIISIESENYHASQSSDAGQNWLESTAKSSYSGASAMQATPAGTTGYYNPGYSSISAGLSYNIEFVTTGIHYLWIRGAGPTTKSDSLHAGLDGVELPETMTIAGFSSGWKWSNTQQSTKARLTIDVSSAGLHTLNLWMRESGMIVDKVVLTTDPNYVPSGTGPTESITSGTPIVSTPSISPAGGSYADVVSISMNANPVGASIYYTMDGSDPDENSILYTGPFDLTGSATIKAIGYLTGYTISGIATSDFIVSSGSVNQTPILNGIGNQSTFEEQTLNFTVTASDPDLTVPILSADLSNLPVAATFDALSGNFTWSPVSGDAGSYSVTFTATDADDSLLFVSETITITVSQPLSTTPYIQDSGSQFLVSIEAENYQGIQQSDAGQNWLATTAKSSYSGASAMQATPAGTTGYYNPGYSSISAGLSYNIEFVTTGIHYLWIRGAGPTTKSDSLHAGLDGVELPETMTIAGFSSGWKWSNTQQSTNARLIIDVTSIGLHTINLWMRESGMIVDKFVLTTDPNYVPSGTGPVHSLLSNAPVVSLPVINPTGGTFTDSVLVSLSTTMPNDATIYFTTDGSDPTTSSQLYVAPFNVTASTTIKVIGIRTGYNDSPISSANFIKINSYNASSFYSHYWELNEPTSGVYNDVVGNNDATCINCPTSANGNVNGSQSFDGIDDELDIADDGSFNWQNGSRFSIELWLNTNSCNGSDAAIGRSDDVTSMEWWIGCENGNAAFSLTDNVGNSDKLLSNSSISDGLWHHLVAIRDGFSETNKLYVDGVLVASSNVIYDVSGFDSVADVNIGWMNDISLDYHFTGQIDEVAIADRVITESEIIRHYNDGYVGLEKGYLADSAATRIMPLGDSITSRVGYRPELYFDLTGFGHNIDFIGSGTDPSGTHDRNHEGHSGFTPADIASSLGSWLNQNSPDLITLHIGTNGQDVLGVEDILNVIDAHDSTIPVVLARIINRSVYHQETTDYNLALQAMADNRIANGDRIVIVDHEPALDYSSDMLDDKHPNSSGYTKMKDVWMSGLQKLLTSNVEVAPTLVTSPGTLTVNSGEQYSYVAEAEGYPLVSYSLQSAPAGMEIHPDTGELTWVSAIPGNYNVIVEASNTNGFDTQAFTITVQ